MFNVSKCAFVGSRIKVNVRSSLVTGISLFISHFVQVSLTLQYSVSSRPDRHKIFSHVPDGGRLF